MSAGGTIQKMEPGLYRIWLSAGKDESGKRIRISERVRGPYREAQKRLAAIRASIDRGEYVARRPDTFGAFMDRWWPSKRATLSPTTAQNYQQWIDKDVMPAIGDRPMQKITSGEISAILSAASARGSDSMAEHLYRLLRMIFRRAEEMGEIAKSPLKGVEAPKVSRRELRVITPDEWASVRSWLERRGDDWWLPLLHVAITTGMRRSEIAGLRWGDFDPERGILTVRRSIHYTDHGGGVPAVTEPKTPKSRRAVALDVGTVAILESHRARCERVARMFDRELTPDSYIFAQVDGKPTRPDSISQMWRKVCRGAGISGVRFHDLRHSAATLLLMAGIPPHVVSERLGHATVGFTLSVYAHVLPTQQTEAAERLAQLLGGTEKKRALAAD